MRNEKSYQNFFFPIKKISLNGLLTIILKASVSISHKLLTFLQSILDMIVTPQVHLLIT